MPPNGVPFGAGLFRRVAFPLLPLLPLAFAAACGLQPREEAVPPRTIEEVQEAHTNEWLELPGVVGSGIGLCDDEEPCIRVFLAHPSPEAEEAIPERVEGYRVELVVTGAFRPRTPPDTAAP